MSAPCAPERDDDPDRFRERVGKPAEPRSAEKPR